MTSKLLITQRALDFSQEWQGILMTACELLKVSYSRELAVEVTMQLASKMTLQDTLELDVSNVSDEDVLEAVAAYEPPPPPELATEVAALRDEFSTFRTQTAELSQRVDSVETFIDDSLVIEQPVKPEIEKGELV